MFIRVYYISGGIMKSVKQKVYRIPIQDAFSLTQKVKHDHAVYVRVDNYINEDLYDIGDNLVVAISFQLREYND